MLCATQTQGGVGTMGTIAIGYDQRIGARGLAGVFLDADFGSVEGTIQDQILGWAGRIKNDRTVSVGARAGYLMNPETLAYVTAGYSNAHFSDTNLVSTYSGTPVNIYTPAASSGGWFIGGGLETQLYNNWFWRTEYRLASYGKMTLPETFAGGSIFAVNFKPIEQTIRSQIVYRLNSGSGNSAGSETVDVPARAARDWTGPYIAGGFGYGMWIADTTTTNSSGAPLTIEKQTQGGRGLFGTLAIGFDVKPLPNIVAGVFLDADLGKITGTIQDQNLLIAGRLSSESKIAVGARAGWLSRPDTLTYVTAGFSRASYGGTDMVQTLSGTPLPFSTSSFSTSGWFIGSGLEIAMSKNWSWKTEYRYASYGKTTVPEMVGTFQIGGIAFQPVEQTVRTEFSYKFNWN